VASISERVHKGLMKWFPTRRRRVVAAVAGLAVVAAVTIAVITRSSGPTRAANQPAVEPVTAPARELPAITPGASTVPVTTTSQTTVAVTTPTAAAGPTTTRSLSPPTAPKATSPLGGPVTLAALPKGWVTLASATGSAGTQSKVFHLQDHNTRLRYVSSGASLVVFVVDAKRGVDATAGYSTADCAGACSDAWMSLHNPAGDYYLVVQATGGRWAVDISEYSGPIQ